jgi:hypothetical protein
VHAFIPARLVKVLGLKGCGRFSNASQSFDLTKQLFFAYATYSFCHEDVQIIKIVISIELNLVLV